VDIGSYCLLLSIAIALLTTMTMPVALSSRRHCCLFIEIQMSS